MLQSITKRINFFISVLVISSILFACLNTTAASQIQESKQQKDERMAWWREARFGMFIHWGLYAIPAGQWNGGTNHAEWIRTTARIPIEQYDKFVDRFNPVRFDAENWVKMAKQAGMKYIVITSKHHDGFCLWDSKQTEYDVMSTPFKRDILEELTNACRKHGIRMCFYHSIMDWHHPDYLPRRDWEKNRSSDGADFSRYITYMKNQLREIISNYDPGVLWFDGEWESTWTHEMGVDLYNYVRSLKKDIIVNNRVDKGRQGMQGMTREGQYMGDFGTPEQEIPDRGLPGVDWESCMTMNNHWGWNKNDKNFKSTEDLVRKLIDIASKGGNFLLNIGPKPDGTFPQESIDRLRQIGDWMDVNGQSIYGTQASPIDKPMWGRCTQKILPDGNTRLFLHVFKWPEDGKLTVLGLRSKPARAYMLATKQNLTAAPCREGIIVDLPSAALNKIATVIVLEIEGKPVVEKVLPGQAADGTMTLSAEMAEIHTESNSQPARVEQINGKANIGYWLDSRTWIDWKYKIKKPGRFDVFTEMACLSADCQFEIKIGDVKWQVTPKNTGSYQSFETYKIGNVEIKKVGDYELEIRPVRKSWQPVNIRSVVLQPVD